MGVLRIEATKALVLACLLLASAEAHAAGDWVNGKAQFNLVCIRCHNADVTRPHPPEYPPAVSPRGTSASYVQGRFNAGTAGTQMGAPYTNVFRTVIMDGITPIDDTVSDIAAYIKNPHFPIASFDNPNSTFAPIAVGQTATRAFRLINSGDADLTVTGASISGGDGYSVDHTACTSTPVTPNNFCDVMVTFQPSSATNFNNRTLSITHLGTIAASSTAPLHGTGLEPFTVSATTLEFTPMTAPAGVLQTTITDNIGDRIRICRADAVTFPDEFSVDPPFTLGAGGCFTSTTTSTLPRSMPLDVRFVAGAVGSRNGSLTIQRVTAGDIGIGIVTTVNLLGNPGPLATVNASSLFDDPSDPGVEVDNDTTLDRTFTVYSRGSDPLIFTGSTFTISGPRASEYSVLPSGCLTLAGLPSGITDPAPSCLVTVRFNPAGLDRRSPALLMVQIAGSPNRTVNLNGLGFSGPRLAVRQLSGPLTSGSSLNFGGQTIGGLYTARTLTLGNGGTVGNLEVVPPAIGSTPGFTVTPDAGCASLAPATQCSVAVHFDPHQALAYAATLVFQSRKAGSSDAYSIFSLTLNGEGAASVLPNLAWTDAAGTVINALAFGHADVGTPAAVTVRLRNDGPGGVVLSLVNAVGAGSNSFILDASACGSGTTLYDGASCAVSMRFAPGSAGAKSAVLQAVTVAGSPTVNVLAPQFVISGTGIGGSATLTLAASMTSLTFSATAGSQSLPVELTVTNTGAHALQVLGYDISAGYAVTEKSCAKAPFTLSPGAQCSLVVTFNPQSEGVVQGVLNMRVDGQSTTLDIALSGNAAPKADVVGGGCTLASGDPRTEPTLWLLVLAAAAVLWWRSTHRRNERNR